MSHSHAVPEPSPTRPWKPWGAARRLFGGPPPAGSKALGRVSSWRAVLGLSTLLVLGRGERGVVETLNEEGWEKAAATVIIALAIVPAAILVLRLRTHHEFRGELRLRPVVVKIVLLASTCYATMTPIILTVQGDWLDALRPTDPPGALISVLLGFASIAYALWVACYVCCAAWWAVRSSCFIGEYHPLLGPAVTTVVVTTATAISLIRFDTNGVPTADWLILTLGGPVTTFVLVVIEYRMLRARGITWRTGPHPLPVTEVS